MKESNISGGEEVWPQMAPYFAFGVNG